MSSFELVPVEIFVLICGHIEAWADVGSLMLTCRSFRNIIKTCPPRNKESEFPRPRRISRTQSQVLELWSRLLTEGNILYNTNRKICGNCHRIRPKSKFASQLQTLLVDKYQICCDCVVKVVRTVFELKSNTKSSNIAQISYQGKVLSKCKNCQESDEDELMHAHYPFTLSKLCEGCHIAYCRDGDCEGWPKDYNPTHRQFLRTKGKEIRNLRKIIDECECDWCVDLYNYPGSWSPFWLFACNESSDEESEIEEGDYSNYDVAGYHLYI